MGQGTIRQEIARQAGDHASAWWRPLERIAWLRLPNWRWRRAAIAVHDVHHVLTGYPLTPRGEMQMAAWEFAAGRYRHPGATAFCLPLVGLGAMAYPVCTFQAFVSGRRSRSLYGLPPSDPMLDLPVSIARQHLARSPAATPRDRAAFAALVLVSWAWMLLPVAVLAAAMMWLVP